MSLLLLDVGNSRLKWTAADAAGPGSGLGEGGAIEHSGNPAAAVAAINIAKADAIWIANVTGAALGDKLAAVVKTHFGVAPRFAAVQAEHAGLRAAYAEPRLLGIDRWLALLAAWTETRGPACVVSAGTALTFDAVDVAGRHLGGVIAPGLLTMQQAVLGATRFPATDPAQIYTEGLGTDTDACVRQGALHAAAGMVERLAGRYAGGGTQCFITGGDAARLMPQLGKGWAVRPNLVMEGLLAYARDAQ